MMRPPTKNPYHHPFVKPLAFDCGLIEAVDLGIFRVVRIDAI